MKTTATISQAAKVIYGNVTAGAGGSLLLGQPGVGKSTIARAVARACGFLPAGADGFAPKSYHEFSTTEYNPIDSAGLYVVEDGYTVRKPTPLIPFDRPVFILIDEFSDCPKFEQSGWYRLLLNHTLGDRKLAAGSYVMAAGNRPEDGAASRELSTAAKGRNCVIELRADFESVLSYGYKANWDSKVLAFIRAFGREVIDNGFDSDCLYAGSTPRDFERISALETAKQISQSADIAALQIVGNLGPKSGLRYQAFRELDIPDPMLALTSPASAPILDSVELATAYCGAIIGAASESHFSAVVDYGLRLDRVNGFGLFDDMRRKFKAFQNSSHFRRAAEVYIELLVSR